MTQMEKDMKPIVSLNSPIIKSKVVMAKKYRLLKDLPDSKAGDIYVLHNNGITGPSCYYKNDNEDESYWLQSNVENSPEWFSEVVEKEFVWTDNLVKKWYMFYMGTEAETYDDALVRFKATNSVPAGKGTANDVLNTDDDNYLNPEYNKRFSKPTANDVLNTEDKVKEKMDFVSDGKMGMYFPKEEDWDVQNIIYERQRAKIGILENHIKYNCYTEDDLMNAFYAARKFPVKAGGIITNIDEHIFQFPQFRDYLKNIKP